MDLAKNLDFSSVTPYAGVTAAEVQSAITPVCFFLFAAVEDVGILQGVSDALRFCPNRRIRFSPLIYFSESPSVEAITRCIAMGFDDVITMPFTRARVAERINRQIGKRRAISAPIAATASPRPNGRPKRAWADSSGGSKSSAI
jgi:hypothetical protein